MTLGEALSVKVGDQVRFGSYRTVYTVARPGVWLSHAEPFYSFHWAGGNRPGLICTTPGHEGYPEWVRLSMCSWENPYRDLDIGPDAGV